MDILLDTRLDFHREHWFIRPGLRRHFGGNPSYAVLTDVMALIFFSLHGSVHQLVLNGLGWVARATTCPADIASSCG